MLTHFDNSDTKRYNQIMKELLNEKEQKVLAGLYRLNSATIGELAKETAINRTSLYPILEKLLQRGLISKLNIEDRIVYQAVSFADFKKWLEREKENTKKMADNLTNWLKFLEKKSGPALLSDFRYFEGVEGIKNLYADSWRDNKDKIIFCITDYKAAYETLGNFFRNEYFPNRINHGIKVKNLIPESKIGRADLKLRKKLLREVKFIDIFEDLGIEVNIYDDKVSIIAYDKVLPSGVLVKNVKISEAMKKIFHYLWDTSKK